MWLVGHGSSRAYGVAGAIKTAVHYARVGLVESLREELAEIGRRGLVEDQE
jgi:fatty acid/phospholipid biosynthesis enzyme